MALTTKTQSDLVNAQVAAMQASSSSLLDFGLGSVLLAICQAVAAVGLWLQALVIQLAALTRLATSYGNDVDSFIADFGMTRLPAIAATGAVTFSRFSTGGQVVVPTGSIMESADGTQSFTVTADPTNNAYSTGLGGYVMAAGIGSVSTPVVAVTPGVVGNIASGLITVIADAISGVDTVANPSPLANGADAESDAAVKVRFVAYINSRSQGTPVAVEYAVKSVAQNLTYNLVENQTYAGAYQPGYFYVVVDDGSVLPSVPQNLLLEASSAVNAARPLTGQFGVFSRVLMPINISMMISDGSAATVQSALIAYVQSLGLGATVEYNKLAQVAYNAAPSINIVATTLNGGNSDVTCTPSQRATPGAIAVGQN